MPGAGRYGVAGEWRGRKEKWVRRRRKTNAGWRRGGMVGGEEDR